MRGSTVMRALLGLALVLPLSAQEALDARALADHPARWSGDYAGALDDLLDRLEVDPASPWAATAWSEVADLSRLGDVALDPARLVRLVATTPEALASLRARRLLADAARRTRFSEQPLRIEGDLWEDVVREWSVLGPYGPLDHPAPLHLPPGADAPETGVRATHPSAYGEDLEWRPLRRGRGQLFVLPARQVPHVGDGVVYLRAHVRLDDEAWLELLCPGELQVWWNGERRLDRRARGPGEDDERHLLPVAPGPGWNELLVRVENRGGTRLAARFLEQSGRSIEAVELDAAAPIPARTEPDPNTQRYTTLFPLEPFGGIPELDGFERSVWMLEQVARGRADRALAMAAPAGDDAQQAAWLRARFEALARSSHLPGEVERRALLEVEQALEAGGALLPEAHAQRVMRLIDEDRPIEALAELDALQARTPPCSTYALLRVVALTGLDDTGHLALEELRRLRAEFPASGRVAAVLARSLTRAGDRVGAAAHWRAALALAGDEQEIQEQGLTALARAGGAHLEQALTWLERWHRDDPDLRRPRELLEHVQRVAGDDAALEQILRAGVAARPDDVAARGGLTRLLIARGRFEEARALLRTQLERRPGDHGLRATLSRLGDRHDAERFFATFAPDREEALAAAGSARDASIAEALDSGLVFLYPDGSSHERYHTITLALDRKGTELLHTEPVADHARLAQVLKQDGAVLEPAEVGGEWVMPFLEPGDAVELVWDQFTSGRRGSAPDIGWWRFSSFEKPFVRSRYAIYVPDGLPGELRFFHFDGEHTERRWGAGTVHVFLAADRARQEEEPLRPSYEEILPWLQFGGDRPVAYVDAIWRDRVALFAHVPADLEAELRALVDRLDPAASDVERAAALFEAVTTHVLAFEGGALAAQVWPTRRGNPIFLLGALFELAGIEFEWAVLRRSIAPELDPAPMQAFEDLRGYELPALRLAGSPPTWVLAPAGRGERFGAVPESLAGAPAWVLGAQGGRIEELPRDQLADSWDLDLEVGYTLEAAGGARVDGTLRMTTSQGSLLREQLAQASAEQRGGAARNLAGQMVPGLDLDQFEFPRLEERGAPLAMTFTGRVPSYARERGGKHMAGLGIPPTRLATGLGAADRRWPLALRFTRNERIRVSIRGGDTWRVARGPHAFREERAGFLHELAVEETAGVWSATRTMRIRGALLAPDEVPAFLTREAELERETARSVELERVQ